MALFSNEKNRLDDFIILQVKGGMISPLFYMGKLKDGRYLRRIYEEGWWTAKYQRWFDSMKHHYN
jgi:hypothetical protein